MTQKPQIRFATLPRRAAIDAKCVAFDLELRQLTDDGATPWVASVGVGTPVQRPGLMIDTGTINTWITSTLCSTDACQAHFQFNPKTSTSYESVDPVPQMVDFGPWGTMTVIIGSDKFTLKEITPDGESPVSLVESLRIQLATNYSGPKFKGLPADGGLAIPSIPVPECVSKPQELLPQLIKEQKIGFALVSFWVDPAMKNGECLFGAIDDSKFDPASAQQLPCLDLTADNLNYLWAVTLNEFNCRGKTVLKDRKFCLDTGSSWFKGSCQMIQTLTDAITNGGRLPKTVDDPAKLAEYPPIEVVLNGKPYTLTPQQYFLQIPPKHGPWVLGFHVLEGMPEDLLLVGSLFLDSLYSVFYYGDGTRETQWVGLASRV